MERKIISAFIVGALILTVIPQTISIYGYIADERYGTFSWLNPYPTGNLLKCLDWHSKDAYIVCENGEFLKWNKYSFETIEIGTDKDLNCIDWNDENAIIVGEGGLVIIYDGIGAKTINSGTNVDLYGVSWKNNDEAIIVGELGTILEYKNGNINTVSAGGSAIYYSVDSAFDNKTSLIVGESGGKGIIVRYDENGLNYIGNYGSELFDVKWKEDSYYALIVGGSGYGWEILSYDGQINIIEENETYRALRSVTWNKEYAIAVGDRGTFLKIDGNKTEEFYTGENNLFGIEWNIELNYSIAVGSGGTVFTFDGKNAVKLSSNALNEYTSLVSLDWKPNREYALGLGRGGWVTIGNWEVSTIVKYDGTKFQVSYYYGAYLYDIAWKKDGKYALAVGSGGTILKINWDKDLEITYIATNSLNNFRAVAWNIYDRALIVGENGAMRIVTDTLTYPVVSGTIKNLYDVSWADEGSYALAVGEDGVVLRYNGITSTKIFDVDENLYGISSFSSTLPCIIVGEKGGIRVYDGHILHSPLQKLTNADLYSVAWEPNGKYALAMGSGGACVRIENNSFYTSLLVTGTNNYLNCIKFTKNYALIFGSLGTVLKYLPNQVPKAVTLSSPTDITDSSLKLSWSKNLDKDFYKYVVYWNTTMDFTYGWAAEIDSRDTNELTIKALNKDTVYYFMVRVYDTGLLYADSNTVWAKTLLGNIPPKAVTLFSPTSISNSSLTLQWSKNNDTDFDKYEVHMSLEKDFVISKDTLINEIKEQNITSYILKGLKDNTTYYFKIRVFDTGGLYNDSNEVSAKTLITNYPPNAVFLYPPKALSSNRILLSWSINNDSDFYSYQIHIANIANFIIENSTLLIEIKNISQNNYIADNLKANTTYYFKIRVYDIGGLYNDSNEDFAKTLPPNDPPIAVILYPPTDITDCSMNLSWSENKDEDFLRYEVHSSLVQNFNITADTILRTFVERNITYTIVTALEPNTTYYFKVRVVDKGGLDNISNEVYGKTILGYPPKAVELYEPKDIKENEVTLIWSENNDSDFEKYEVHSSVEKNFTPTPETFKIGISIRSITNQRLTGLNPNTTYYFKIRVLDKTLLYNDSNEVNATTLGPNLPPKSVTLITKNITKHSIMVEWSRNIDNDFLKYEIHMSMDKNFSITQLTLVANITAQDITDYDIKNLTKNTTYYFKIRVYDNSNLFNDSNEVDAKTLENLLPVVKLSASKNSAYVGEKIKFSSSGSYDPDGKIISYVWNFGIDEYTTSKGEDIEYIYTQSGNYNVTLKVIDDDYESSIAKTEIEIKDKENIPPIADAGNDLKGIVGEEVYFNGKGYDPDGKIIEYSWDFDGDGIYDFKSDIGDAKYIYEIAGEYTAILKVLDDRGATGIDSCKVSITMKNRVPIPIITKPVDGSRFIFGEVIKFDGSLSYDEDGDKISYKWYSDKDGIIGKTNAFETILSIGLHTITLEVSDGKEKNSATIKITVLEKPNKAPLIKITSPINGSKVSGNVMVFGSASDDKKVSKVEIRIDNGDWVRAEGEKSWYYIWNTKNVEEGAHYIYAKATDSDGEETTTYIVVSLAKKKKEEKIFIPGFYAILLIFSIICVKFLRRTWN